MSKIGMPSRNTRKATPHLLTCLVFKIKLLWVDIWVRFLCISFLPRFRMMVSGATNRLLGSWFVLMCNQKPCIIFLHKEFMVCVHYKDKKQLLGYVFSNISQRYGTFASSLQSTSFVSCQRKAVTGLHSSSGKTSALST